jgi:hypothetical protein
MKGLLNIDLFKFIEKMINHEPMNIARGRTVRPWPQRVTGKKAWKKRGKRPRK